jgi:L-threonylcarbamoyladenylate synthase
LSPWKLRQAAHIINTGGVIAYPTEAVYGLGCDPLNREAVYRLLALKRRAPDKGLILIAASLDQLQPFVAPLSTEERATLNATWPGPVTWLLRPGAGAPPWITGAHDSIAVRVTGHPLARDLCKAAGHALVSTSANPAGKLPAKSALAVRCYFPSQLDFILCGALGGLAKPTEIRDLTSGAVIRSD